jgi:hypothetical protein
MVRHSVHGRGRRYSVERCANEVLRFDILYVFGQRGSPRRGGDEAIMAWPRLVLDETPNHERLDRAQQDQRRGLRRSLGVRDLGERSALKW